MSTRRPHPTSRRIVPLLSLLLLAWSFPVVAAIPEPVNVFFGQVQVDGQPVDSGTVTAVLDGRTQPLASYQLGTTESLGHQYLLPLPIDSVGLQSQDSARPGDLVRFYIDGRLAARTIVDARGTPRRLDLDTRFNDVDLALDLTASAQPVLAGTDLTLTLTASNAGPGQELDAQIVYTLPGGFTFLGVTFDQGSCSHTAGLVTCQLGPLAAGASADLEIAVSVDPSLAHGALPGHLASISGTETDELSAANNVKTLLTTVHRSADLEIVSHLDTPEPVVAGQPVTYTLAVRNNGPSLASAVTLVDQLPSGLTLDQALPSQGACTGNTTVSCGLGQLPRGATATVVLTSLVPASMPADAILTNQANLAGAENDASTGSNASSAQTTIRREIDLLATHISWPTTATAGQAGSYVVQVRNQGVSHASAVRLTDTLPSGFHFDSVTPATGCSVQGSILTCQLGVLASAASVTRTIQGSFSPLLPHGAQLSNTATVSALATEVDLLSANDSESRQTRITSQADLSLVQVASPSPATAGSALRYELTVTNSGPSDAVSVTLTDTLPAAFVYESFQVQPDPILYSVDRDSDRLRVIDATSGASRSPLFLQLAGQRVLAGHGLATHPTTHKLWALLQLDGQPGHQLVQLDPATGIATSIGDTGLRLHGLTFDPAGQLFALSADTETPAETLYQLDPNTALPTPRTALTSGLLGEALAFHAASGLLYHASGPGDAASLLETVHPVSLVRTAISPFGVPYGVPSAWTATTSGNLLLADDRSTLLAVTPTGVVSAIGGLDHVPGGLAFAPRTVACLHSQGTVVCQLGRLGTAESLTVSLLGQLTPQASDWVLNQATAISSSVDVAPANNLDLRLITPLSASADLGIAYQPLSGPAIAGTDQSFVLEVLNQGPSRAQQAVLTNGLPAGTTLVSATLDPPAGACTPTSGGFQCPLGDLEPGQTGRVRFVVHIDPAFRGNLSNQAAASSTTADPSAADNTGVLLAVPVQAEAGLAVNQPGAPLSSVAGESISYPILIRNTGPSQAQLVRLDSHWTGVAQLVSAAGGGADCSRQTQALECTLPSLDPDQTASILLTVQLDPNAASGSVWSSVATADSGDPDGFPLDNESTAQATVTRRIDLELQADPPQALAADQPLTYDFTVRNDGPSAASSLRLTQSLPLGTHFDATASAPECSATATQITCLRDSLTRSSTWNPKVTLSVDASLSDGNVLSSTATVTAAEAEADPIDNTRLLQTALQPVCTRSSGCMDWALLHGDAEVDRQHVRFTWRITNRCASPLKRLELRFKPAAAVTGFTEGQSYVSTRGQTYTVHLIDDSNAGIAFEPVGEGLHSGQFDLFTLRVQSADLVDQTQFWLWATTQDQQPAGSISSWTPCFPASARLSVTKPQACARPSAEAGLDSVNLRWTLHPWAASKRFQVYRLESGNPDPVLITPQILSPETSNTVKFTDTVVSGLRPAYRIQPLTAGNQPLEPLVLASTVCEATVAQPTPPWWLLGLLLLASLTARRRLQHRKR